MFRRPPATLADYLVVAITPTLIGLLVGSLMWFLVEVFYHGEFKFRLLWVMTMFVVAIVGISRIAMEQGFARASLFALPLAGALGLVLPPIGWPLMALVWWAAHKLTWDATLIDDSQDASGQGLLEQMGLDPSGCVLPSKTRHSASQAEAPVATDPEATTTAELPPAPPWWETLLEPDRRPHAPGVWVIYFSLAALPLFGIGGWFVSDPVARARVFGLLVVYVASGMGLLLATSFLGLRRYLRQRKLEMPLEMTSTWIVVGVVMICAMLLVAAILPRPRREQSLSQLPFAVTSAARRASRIAFLKEGTKDDTAKDPATTDAQKGQETSRQGGQQGGKSEGSQQQGQSQGQKSDGSSKASGKSGDGKVGSAAGKSQSSKGGGDSKGGKQSGDSKADKESQSQSPEANAKKGPNDSEQRGDTEKQESTQQRSQAPPPDASQPEPQPPPSNPSSPSRVLSQVTSALSQLLGGALRWLFYAILLAGVLVAAWYYRDDLLAAWQKLMDELRELWESWFGGKKVAQVNETAEVAAPPRMFASYADPFLTGNAARMSWPQLVRYTFEALEAWGREHDCPRNPGQTAHEFALALSSVDPDIANQVNSLAAWYSQLAYAPRSNASGAPERLRELWANLGSRRSAPVAL